MSQITNPAINVASSFAGATQAAHQVARERDRAASDASRDIRRLADRLDAHTQAVEEADETPSADQVHIDPDPERRQGRGGYEPPRHQHRQHAQPDAGAENAESLAAMDTPAPVAHAARHPHAAPPPPGQLYKHLDVQA